MAHDALRSLLEGPLTAAGFDLEGLAVRRAGSRHVVSVVVDRDGGVDLDAVAVASRTVSEALDAPTAQLPSALAGPYTLEVTSPGVDRPLTASRHWRRAVGRLVEVRRREGAPLTGRVLTADDDGAELDVAGKPMRLPFADVQSAVIEIEFRAPHQGATSDDATSDDATSDDATSDHVDDEVSRP